MTEICLEHKANEQNKVRKLNPKNYRRYSKRRRENYLKSFFFTLKLKSLTYYKNKSNKSKNTK